MTPEQHEAERIQITSECDKLVDAYYAGTHDIHSLVDMRRELAVWSYRLSAHIQQVHGEAGLTYLQRKFRIAESIVDARANDAKAPFNILEQGAQKMPSVVAAQKAEIYAEAAKEALRSKLQFVIQVLASMQQELSILSHEMKSAHYQDGGK